MSNMASREVHKDGGNKAPGQTGRTDIGYDNLIVDCILWPKLDEVKYVLSKASVAVKGSIVGKNEVDEASVNDMFKGGLNQALEWFTVVFECSGVSRGLTHQLVRTRKASFSQQSMRYADMGNLNVRMPEEIAKRTDLHFIDSGFDVNGNPYGNYPFLGEAFGHNASPAEVWEHSVEIAREAYSWLTEHNVPMQDARTVCPIGTETYILCEYPLSEFINVYAYRACQMFYPEMVAIMGLMKASLLDKCPWLEPMLKITCEKTSGGINGLPHKCTYQGWERVEGQCEFPWALEDNRTFKSTRVEK